MSNSFNRTNGNQRIIDDDDLRYETNEKETLVKRLNQHIYEIEKNETNFKKLTSRFKGLQQE